MAMPRIDYGDRRSAYEGYARALQMKNNAENQRRARDIDREGLFGTGIKTSHIKGIGDSLMSAYKIAHAAKQEKLTNLKDGHKREMDALYEGINSLPETGEGAKLRAKLGLQAIKAQENFNNQFQQFSDKGVTEFTRGGRESMVLNRLPKQTLDELETALSGESGAKVDKEGFTSFSQRDYEEQKEAAMPYDQGIDRTTAAQASSAKDSYLPGQVISQARPHIGGGQSMTKPKGEPKPLEHHSFKPENMQARKSDQGIMNLGSHVMDDDWQYGDQPPNEQQRPPWGRS